MIKRFAAAAFAALLLLLASCAPASPAGNKDSAPAITPAPQVPFSTTHYIRYWPEDADYSTCDYSCVIELPEFDGGYTAAYSMNKAVKEYVDGLASRIETDYLPGAEGEKHTEVTVGVEYIPGCTNVIFSEEHSFSEAPVKRTYVLMLDDRGAEINLCDLFLDYHTAERAAELAAERLRCGYGEALAAVDVNHGAKATLAGCTVYAFINGAETPLDFTFDELSPASRFDAVSLKEFRAITELTWFVSDAAVVRQENIEDGVLSAFEASSFMGEFTRTLGICPSAGRLSIPQKDFEGYYRSIFGQDLPGIDADGHDIKLENGVYSVRDSAKPYEYHLDILGIEADGDILRVTGDMIFGRFGYAYTEYVCHVTVELLRSETSPYGFVLKKYVMSV